MKNREETKRIIEDARETIMELKSPYSLEGKKSVD